MDLSQIVTIAAVAIANLGTMIAFYLNLDRKIDENRRETTTLMDENRKEVSAILKAIQEEMKDFHGRLCAIEERNKK